MHLNASDHGTLHLAGNVAHRAAFQRFIYLCCTAWAYLSRDCANSDSSTHCVVSVVHHVARSTHSMNRKKNSQFHSFWSSKSKQTQEICADLFFRKKSVCVCPSVCSRPESGCRWTRWGNRARMKKFKLWPKLSSSPGRSCWVRFSSWRQTQTAKKNRRMVIITSVCSTDRIKASND